MSSKTDAREERALNAINALLADIKAAWAANDADRMAQSFAEDAIFVPFNGSRLLGRAAIAKFHAQPFATELQGSRLLVDLVDIRPLSETLYLVSTSGGPARQGQESPPQATQSYICQDIGDRWAILFFQNTPVRSPPGAP
ncbi:SgcJ/EcaC family oxidoreductase [Bradyrhizobium sp. ma5]|uniref:SgcJ/EcaC family oxidoreductase n=1 Tax=Bradyrhizobium sp. ma5 TaxID=3344828 RepID=UPI0035D4E009